MTPDALRIALRMWFAPFLAFVPARIPLPLPVGNDEPKRRKDDERSLV